MKHKLILCLVMMAISPIVKSQTLQTWTWDQYKMQFKAPDNMTVNQNDASAFRATNNNITLEIYPRQGENLTYDGMKNAIINWANQSSLSFNPYNSNGDAQPIYLSNVNGYWGCAIDGTKSGYSASALLLVDPDYPNISFYVWISYAEEYYHDAVTILKSFEPVR
jgi:Dihydro-orotase-like